MIRATALWHIIIRKNIFHQFAFWLPSNHLVKIPFFYLHKVLDVKLSGLFPLSFHVLWHWQLIFQYRRIHPAKYSLFNLPSLGSATNQGVILPLPYSIHPNTFRLQKSIFVLCPLSRSRYLCTGVLRLHSHKLQLTLNGLLYFLPPKYSIF